MSYNPYQTPQSPLGPSYGVTNSQAQARNAVAGPATSLMVVAGISIACLSLAIAFDVFLLASGKAAELDRGGEINPVVTIIIRTIWGLAILAASGFTFWGALEMRQLRNYSVARAAAIVAVIPCLGPCCLLGIPFGIWGLSVLGKPEVKSAFTS